MARKKRPALERYLEKISPVADENGCRVWLRSTRKGYGALRDDSGRTVPAHVFGYRALVGPIPDGLMVCHTCDNRPCQEPTHWFLGTCQDNMRDAAAKGRIPGNRSKRTPETIAKISGPRSAEWRRRVVEAGLKRRKTHCIHGHPLDGVKRDGRQYCKTCARLRWRRQDERRKKAS